MGQSLTQNYIHIIFGTKYRTNLILPQVEEDLYDFIKSTSASLSCFLFAIGGTANHVHILCHLSKNIALAKLVETIKSHSSKWIKTRGDEYKKFYWQNGYGAFSVSPQNLEVVKKYILNQKEHHRVKNFKEEFLEILQEYNIEYDEKFLWD